VLYLAFGLHSTFSYFPVWDCGYFHDDVTSGQVPDGRVPILVVSYSGRSLIVSDPILVWKNLSALYIA